MQHSLLLVVCKDGKPGRNPKIYAGSFRELAWLIRITGEYYRCAAYHFRLRRARMPEAMIIPPEMRFTHRS